ncbi:MAG: NADH-quinone oxidoreductase subunit J [Proteobacteria bacterium]|nr:NADH-quinone oxidoreductase subunit J [Pseudomonadota bacterium]NCA28211.1 NADH-quinone oxidoreductase subunit J [Pseudomonadota bacterium]
MNFTLYLFYIFSFVLISSSLAVVVSRNMVNAVIFLILAFFNVAGLFILLGAEYLAMLLIVVYVGAIAVLFLFVVMMLNVDLKIIENINRRKPLITMLTLIIFCELFLITKFSSINYTNNVIKFPTPQNIHNTKAIGKILYTDFFLPFQVSGAILFVAMIGAIVLTLKPEKRFIRKQNIASQVHRTRDESLEIIKVKSGQGIDL